MRFLNLLVLAGSGCAVVDAAGDPHGGVQRVVFRKDNLKETSFAPRAAVVAEVDGNDIPDLIVLGETTGELIECLRSDLLAPFACTTIPAFSGYSHVIAADLDGDGDTELVVAGDNKLEVLTQDRTMADRYVRPVQLTITGMPVAVGTRLDIDGSLSVLVATLGGGSMAQLVLVKTPMTTPAPTTPMPINSSTTDFVVGDFSPTSGDEVILVFNSTVVDQLGGPDLSDSQSIMFPSSPVRSLASGQFDESAQPDIVALLEDGTLQFRFGTETGLDENNQFVNAIRGDAMETGNFDGNGRDDIVILSPGAGGERRLRFMVADQQGRFLPDEIQLDGNPTALSVGDLDGDGITDVILAPGDGGGVDVFLSRQL